MTEQDFIARIKPHLTPGPILPPGILAIAADAVRAHQNCAELWFLHAQAHACCDDEEGCFDAVSLESYRRCIELDPSYAEAHEQLGHFYDGVKDDPEKAMDHYRKAAELRGEALKL